MSLISSSSFGIWQHLKCFALKTHAHTHTHSIEDAVGHSIVTEMLFILEAEAKLCSQLLLLQQFLLSSSDFASELSWQVGPRDDPACPCPFFLSSS